MTHKYGSPQGNTATYGYDTVKAIVKVLTAHSPSVWDGMSALEIVEACEAADLAGVLGYADPVRRSDNVLRWMQDDDCVATWVRQGPALPLDVTEEGCPFCADDCARCTRSFECCGDCRNHPADSGTDDARDRAADKEVNRELVAVRAALKDKEGGE